MNNIVAISGLGGCNCGPAAGTGEYFAPNGMGEYFAPSGMGAYARPVGEDPAPPALPKWVPVVAVGGVVLGMVWLIFRMEAAEAA